MQTWFDRDAIGVERAQTRRRLQGPMKFASGPDCRANAPERPNAAILPQLRKQVAPARHAASDQAQRWRCDAAAERVAAAPAAVHAPVAQTVPAE